MSITIRKLIVPRHQRIIAQGQSVTLIAEIADVTVTSILTDPANVPLVSIFNPSGTALVTDTSMSRLSLGLFSYTFPTAALHPVGAYTISVTVVHDTSVARLERVTAFVIKKTTTLAAFTYLIMQDQTGVLWYWFIAVDNTLNSLPAIPVVLGKQALSIPLLTVPRWLQINNASAAIRYVYPAIDGTVTVSDTQPAVGSGNLGSPTFAAVNGGNIQLGLNVSDEVIYVTVP